MAAYTLTKLRSMGDTDMYEVRLPDGSSNKFVYTGAQKAVDPSDDAFQHWVAISIRRVQRESDYMKARHATA